MNLLFFSGMMLIPVAAAVAMFFLRERWLLNRVFTAALAATLLCTLALAACPDRLVLDWDFPGLGVSLRFGFDGMGRFFGLLFGVIFLLSGIFSLEYMDHDHAPGRYNAFYLLTLWAMLGLSTAQSLAAYYMCYELMTMLSLPLVLHEATDGAMKAGMKYLGYSLFGASLALFGFFVLGGYSTPETDVTNFTAGGAFAGVTPSPVLLLAAFCLLLGFGGKAGLMPLHYWLPTAHPVAPAPASAVLSATITKAGVLGIIRVIYYVLGPEVLRGTWVQYALLTLALCTVFTGSMLAYKEKLMKRRFAWSTVSQVSYVLFGVFLLTPVALEAALLQVVFHAVCKTALFLTAGAIIHHTGCTYVHQLTGIGRRMPVVMTCYTLSSLSLIGIPPFAGFVSKWGLATGGMGVVPVFGVLGAAVLLVSAILTAGYLLPLTIKGFFYSGEDDTPLHPTWRMLVPLAVLSGALLLLGLFPHGLVQAVHSLPVLG